MTALNLQAAAPERTFTIKDTLKDTLAQKITNSEDLDSIWNHFTEPTLPSSSVIHTHPLRVGSSNAHYYNFWWLRREAFREAAGVYPPATGLLKWVRASAGMGCLWPHCSVDGDPDRVAYTPDRQAGLADKQVVTTIGRFLRKYLPLCSDEEIERLAAAHRAEQDPHFLQATTVEEVERVYTSMSGDSACMRYDRSRFTYLEGKWHPSAVYALSPGMSVAYITNPDGDITARSVIYVNPEDPTDKRYVRLYGDHATLRTKLERNGFRLAGLAGCKIAPLHITGNRYVMPYIDVPGGGEAGCTDQRPEGCVFWAGDEYITIIGQTERYALEHKGVSMYGIRSTNAFTEINVRPMRPGSEFVCAMTGQTHKADGSSRQTVDWMRPDGTLGLALRSAVLNAPHSTVTHVASRGTSRTVCTSPETKAALCWPGTDVVRSVEAAAYYDVAELDARRYPEGTIAMHTSHIAALCEVTDALDLTTDTLRWPATSVGFIRNDDGVQVIGNDDISLWIHKDLVPEFKKRGFVKTHDLNNIATMASKDNPNLATTRSGKKVLLGRHETVLSYDGVRDFSSTVEWVAMFGVQLAGNGRLLRQSLCQPVEQALVDAVAQGLYERAIWEFECGHTADNITARLRERLVQGVSSNGYFYTMASGDSSPSYQRRSWSTPEQRDIANLKRAAEYFLDSSRTVDELRIQVGQDGVRSATLWAHITLQLDSIIRKAGLHFGLTTGIDNLCSLSPEELARRFPEHAPQAPTEVAAEVPAVTNDEQ